MFILNNFQIPLKIPFENELKMRIFHKMLSYSISLRYDSSDRDDLKREIVSDLQRSGFDLQTGEINATNAVKREEAAQLLATARFIAENISFPLELRFSDDSVTKSIESVEKKREFYILCFQYKYIVKVHQLIIDELLRQYNIELHLPEPVADSLRITINDQTLDKIEQKLVNGLGLQQSDFDDSIEIIQRIKSAVTLEKELIGLSVECENGRIGLKSQLTWKTQDELSKKAEEMARNAFNVENPINLLSISFGS